MLHNWMKSLLWDMEHSKKVSLTGSISNVGTQDLKSMPVSSVTNALGGRIPGTSNPTGERTSRW